MKIVISTLSEVWDYLKEPLRKNALFFIMSNVLAAGLGFVFWVIVARNYISSEVGQATAMIAAITLLADLSSLGFQYGLIRFLPQEGSRERLINTCLTVSGLCSLVLVAVFILGLPLWSPSLLFARHDFLLLSSIIIFTMAFAISEMQKSAFVSLRSGGFFFVQRMVFLVARVAIVLPLVLFGVLGILTSWWIALCLALVVGTILLRRLQRGYRPLPTLDKRIVNDIVCFSLGNYVAYNISSAPVTILPLLVLSLLGAEANAFYFIALTIASFLLFVPSSVSSSLFAEGSTHPERLRTNVIRATKFICLLLIPALIVVFLLGDKILLLFGKEYSRNSLEVLWLISLSSLPAAINSLYITLKQVQKKVRPIILVQTLKAVSIFVACYSLMRWLGLIGAGWGFVVGQGVISLGIGLVVLRQYGMRGVISYISGKGS